MQGLTLDKVFVERGVSGSKPIADRPQGAALLAVLQPGDTVITPKLDRMFRSALDALDAAIRILRETGGKASIVSFNISEPDLENFMKQPWTVTSSDGGPGHPREYATFQTKYAVYVKQKHTIDTGFFIRHSSGLTADIFKLDRRGYLKAGYFADVLVFDPNGYVPKADYIHPAVLSEGVKELFVNGVAAVDNGTPTGATAGRPLPHTPPIGTCN